MGRSRQERKAYKKAAKKEQYKVKYGEKIKHINNNVNPKIAKMCLNKIRYFNYSSAINGCIYYSCLGKPLIVYRCPNCHNWHITSHVKK